MPENRMYLPEGMQGNVLYTISDIQEAQKTGAILEGTVLRCEENHDLVVSLGGLTGRIPREEAIHPPSAAPGGRSPYCPWWESQCAAASPPWKRMKPDGPA